MARDQDFERVGNLLGDACDAAALAGDTARASIGREEALVSTSSLPDPARALAALWPAVAGPGVAANARPVQLSRGRLIVSTSSSAWAQTLGYMESELKERLNDHLGPGTIEQIVFRHAGWEERGRSRRTGSPFEQPACSAPLSSSQREALAEVEELDLPPETRKRIVAAMKASFVRGGQDSVR